MRVLMFGWELPPFNSGGLGTACLGLARALVRNNTDITFVLPKRLPLAYDFLKIVFADLPEFSSSAYSRYGKNLLEEVYCFSERAAALARREKFDLIHAHDWLTFGAGLAARDISRRPLLAHVHATEFDRTGGQRVNPAVYALEKEGMERADGIIAVSRRTKNLISEHYGIKPQKIRVIHNGIEEKDYPPRPPAKDLLQLKKLGEKIVLFVGRLTLQKGPDYFLRAAKLVLRLRPETIFVIAGAGDMEGQIINQAIALGIAERVLFAGFLRGEELNRLYELADVYVLPSVSEPFGITPLEALINGTPVLISKQSGVAEVLNHALKVDFWDVGEMANQIIAVLDYPALQDLLWTAGGEEVRKITWQAAAQKCVNLYEETLTR